MLTMGKIRVCICLDKQLLAQHTFLLLKPLKYVFIIQLLGPVSLCLSIGYKNVGGEWHQIRDIYGVTMYQLGQLTRVFCVEPTRTSFTACLSVRWTFSRVTWHWSLATRPGWPSIDKSWGKWPAKEYLWNKRKRLCKREASLQPSWLLYWHCWLHHSPSGLWEVWLERLWVACCKECWTTFKPWPKSCISLTQRWWNQL